MRTTAGVVGDLVAVSKRRQLSDVHGQWSEGVERGGNDRRTDSSRRKSFPNDAVRGRIGRCAFREVETGAYRIVDSSSW